jgi:hypothetical protein
MFASSQFTVQTAPGLQPNSTNRNRTPTESSTDRILNRQSSKDAQEGLSKTLDSISSMASVEEDQIYRDPSDPTRVGCGCAL